MPTQTNNNWTWVDDDFDPNAGPILLLCMHLARTSVDSLQLLSHTLCVAFTEYTQISIIYFICLSELLWFFVSSILFI